MINATRCFALVFLTCFVFACGDEPGSGSSESAGGGDVFERFMQCHGDGEKTIRLPTLDWEPYIGANLENFGPVHELVVAAFARRGYKVCTAFLPWSRTNHMGIEGKEVDGYFPEYYSADYEEVLAFSDGYPAGPAGFYKRKDQQVTFSTRLGMEDFRGLSDYRIGTVRGYVNTEPLDRALGQFVDSIEDPDAKARALEAAYLHENLDQARSDEVNLEKLYHDRVQLVFIDPNVARYKIRTSLVDKYPDIEDSLEFMQPPLINHKVYTCFSRNAPDYERKLADFNDGLREIKADGTLRRIMERHGFVTNDGENFRYVGR